MMAAVRSRRPWSTLRRIASGSNSAAARAIRDHATNAGAMPASTAILMKRYGTPQITELRMKRSHARLVIALGAAEEALGRLAPEELLDDRVEQAHLGDDGGVRGRRKNGEARGRQRLAHVAHGAAAEQAEQRHVVLERRDVGVAGDDEYRGLQGLHVGLPGHRLALERD